MGSLAVFLLFSITAINSVSSAKRPNFSSWVMSELGNIEHLDASAIVPDSSSTQEELSTAVIFYLYTNSSQETPEVIFVDDDDALSYSSFDTEIPTRILIHGWTNSVNSSMPTSIREAYLAGGTYNVIVVDWSAYAEKDYVYAAGKVVTVGKYVGQMIDFLVNEGMNCENLIVIGHSLGAHAAGVACRSANSTVSSLIGLDPAGPLFYVADMIARMRRTDAAYVQTIKTNAGALGFAGDLGDANFSPNGGANQPGCGIGVSGASCSHDRSYLYFAESVAPIPGQFTAEACGNYLFYEFNFCSSKDSGYMGGSRLDRTASGNYYLKTNSAFPYAQG